MPCVECGVIYVMGSGCGGHVWVMVPWGGGLVPLSGETLVQVHTRAHTQGKEKCFRP